VGVVFRRKDEMEARKLEDANRRYYGFWYTLDLILPVINLGVADLWRPKQERWCVENWLIVLKIVGWVVVPVVVAAAGGFVK
jgi:hypothetical protein